MEFGVTLGMTIESAFDDGRNAEHRLGTRSCAAEHMHPEGIGRLMENGHALLAQIQRVPLEGQMEEISTLRRACPCFGAVRPIHDVRPRTLVAL